MTEPTRLRILSLDGGGIRGLSSLELLKKIFNGFKVELNPPQPGLKPCDFFHLIGGTNKSSDGLIGCLDGDNRR
jgi:patatin-like phospholipase/acyl hydrolase